MSDQTQETRKKTYKKTLNLPKTTFKMKANLVQREPEFQKRWDRLGLYRRLREQPHPKGPFCLHDGPPYANGPIHLGHLLNKVLKDLVIRSRGMLGYDAPFVPGWDCHGLPIEHKALKEAGDRAREMSTHDIRRRCRKDAEKFIKLQSKQMRRLGTIGDYDDPYLTMNPGYEAATLEVFADLVAEKLVYRDLKPVHWSIANRTALADAELEYRERADTSIYAMFEVANPENLPDSLMARPGGGTPSLMIWTTTPWTLPANLAVAASPAAEYILCRWDHEGGEGLTLLAADLAERVFEQAGVNYDELGVCTGAELEAAGVRYRHPFIDRTSPVVTADYVTLEDGTGLVHTAPGHGVEDYQTGLRCGLDIYCPVRGDGTFDDTAPHWLRGESVWDANGAIVERLRESGNLLHDEPFTHSYPHDWRSKTPVIFRATEQWFIGVNQPFDRPSTEGGHGQAESAELGRADGPTGTAEHEETLRNRALEATAADVRFFPAWGRKRMRGMLDSRPDWCISRQRAWGLPIPAFFPPEDVEVDSDDTPFLLTPASVRAIAKLIGERGSDAWFAAPPEDLLAHYEAKADPDAPAWVQSKNGDPKSRLTKGTDIFDVWFESGSSWNAVLRRRGLPFPADLYLEGSDQHRGWFQLSLLPALGVTGKPPFKALLTHGFMVDRYGKKMSKSLGNALDVEDLMKDYGADVCRWWVASLNPDNDVKVDPAYFRHAGEEYRKVRNTIRFLLSNLSDFDPASDRRELTVEDSRTLDAWARDQTSGLVEAVAKAYEGYDFRRAHESIFHFCNETMSAVYLAAVKDRLYCDREDSDRRRRTQTQLYDITATLTLLVAPILVHTAEEAWLALHGEEMTGGTSVHTELLPDPAAPMADPAWGDAVALRDRVLKHIEDARAQRGLDNPLDAGVEAALPQDLYEKLKPLEPELADLCGVSRFTLDDNGPETLAVDDLTQELRCERSWKRDGTVKERSDGGLLTDRDAEAVGV